MAWLRLVERVTGSTNITHLHIFAGYISLVIILKDKGQIVFAYHIVLS
jgi:hypothetical protein